MNKKLKKEDVMKAINKFGRKTFDGKLAKFMLNKEFEWFKHLKKDIHNL